jgi:hypothetical protein
MLMSMKQTHIFPKMLTGAHNGEEIIIGKASKPYADKDGLSL